MVALPQVRGETPPGSPVREPPRTASARALRATRPQPGPRCRGETNRVIGVMATPSDLEKRGHTLTWYYARHACTIDGDQFDGRRHRVRGVGGGSAACRTAWPARRLHARCSGPWYMLRSLPSTWPRSQLSPLRISSPQRGQMTPPASTTGRQWARARWCADPYPLASVEPLRGMGQSRGSRLG